MKNSNLKKKNIEFLKQNHTFELKSLNSLSKTYTFDRNQLKKKEKGKKGEKKKKEGSINNQRRKNRTKSRFYLGCFRDCYWCYCDRWCDV